MEDNKYYGIYQGVVTNTNDPEKRGRIKIKCPDVLGDDIESAWCDPCVPVSFDGGGDFCMPDKEETVWVMFIAGDANRPVWLGNWWSKNKTPLGDNYKDINDVRIINYADCTITMHSGVIDINVGEGTCDLRIEHNEVTVKGKLTVEGNISCYALNAGTIHAGKNEKGGGGTITADSTITAVGAVHGSNI